MPMEDAAATGRADGSAQPPSTELCPEERRVNVGLCASVSQQHDPAIAPQQQPTRPLDGATAAAAAAAAAAGRRPLSQLRARPTAPSAQKLEGVKIYRDLPRNGQRSIDEFVIVGEPDRMERPLHA